MRPTSESDRDARSPDFPDSASTDDTVRNDPWATGPGHLTHDDQTERFVPEQRDPQDHDGHLYASDTYAEPETTVLPQQEQDGSQGGRHATDEPTAVGVAHVDTSAGTSEAGTSDADTDKAGTSEAGTSEAGTDKADDAAARADQAREEAEEARAEAEEARHEASEAEEARHEVSAAELESTREEPAVVVEPVPEPVPVAVVDTTPVDQTPVDGTTTDGTAADGTPAEDSASELRPGDVPVTPVAGFFAADAAQGLRDRWREAQLGFVDDPRKAVEDVKALVTEAVDQFTAAVSRQRDELDAAAGEDTEQYRVAVQRYRAFFDRLLNL